MNPSFQFLWKVDVVHWSPCMMWQSFHSLLRDSSRNSQKILEWKVLQAGGPCPCTGTMPACKTPPFQLLQDRAPGRAPQAPGLIHPKETKPGNPPACPWVSGRVSRLRGWAGDKRVCSRYRTPKVKGFRSHWQIILQAPLIQVEQILCQTCGKNTYILWKRKSCPKILWEMFVLISIILNYGAYRKWQVNYKYRVISYLREKKAWCDQNRWIFFSQKNTQFLK